MKLVSPVILQRFESKFQKTPKCWNWQGACNNGYGVFKYGGKIILAHRLSYEIYITEIVNGMIVCHRCDNPKCVNPNHLFLGTQKDNIHDMYTKGRAVDNSGEAHGSVKLNKDNIIKIKEMRMYGYLLKEIAQSFGVSYPHISKICNGKKWKTL